MDRNIHDLQATPVSTRQCELESKKLCSAVPGNIMYECGWFKNIESTSDSPQNILEQLDIPRPSVTGLVEHLPSES
jgi:hypothetical protein